MNVLIYIQVLLLITIALGSEATHYYGEEMFADVTSNATMATITIGWRIMWRNANSPSSITLTTCAAGLGTPCPSGGTSIDMALNNYCVATGISTMDSSASYDSWAGSNSALYYPIGSVPPANSTIGMIFSSGDWGLLTDTNILSFGGQLLIMTGRRLDNGLFNRTPRTAVAGVITIWPDCGGEIFKIPVSDPDSDIVKCRWSNSTNECHDCCYTSLVNGLSYYSYYSFTFVTTPGDYPFELSSNCTLTYTGGAVTTKKYYPICIQMEDFYPSRPNVRISSASLQFIVEVASLPCSMQVSPLVTDNCSVAMMTPSSGCPGSPAAVAPNAQIQSFSNAVGTSLNLSCIYGYTVVPSGVLNVTCVQVNASAAWVANAQCTGK